MSKVWKAAVVGGIAVMTVVILQAGATAGAHSRAQLSVAHGASHRYRLRIANTMVGPLLVNQRGYTVFMFNKDRRDDDVCAKRVPPEPSAEARARSAASRGRSRAAG